MLDPSQKGVFHKLSQREFEVANLIIRGKKTKEIAAELNIKSNTVSTIKKSIFYKLNISTVIDLFNLSQNQ
jgi:two-component system invasion response regulator UvrY